MKVTFKAFAKNLFGAKYERLPKNLFICLLVFWGVHTAHWRVEISPFIRYLMLGTFTAGVMWQALCSENNAANMQNICMLPFDNRKFVFSYIAALGAYTVFTKTAALLAVLLAVSVFRPAEIFGSVVCVIHAVLMTAAVYSLKKYRYGVSLWSSVVIAVILLFGNKPWFILVMIVNGVFAASFLQRAEGCVFYEWEGKKSPRVKAYKHYSVLRYLFRYLSCHKNYLINMAVMWGIAIILPRFLGEMGNLFVIPIGFAILSINTPVCILLSCDPALEQAIRFLPGQKKAFCIPYCLFIFLCNMAADVIFLFSWQILNGGITVQIIAAAVFFAMQSAILSVLLEWFYPVRKWKIESDLWHHPRKYIVPVIMLLIAGAVGTFPALMPGLLVLLAVEVLVLFYHL